jgi:hypothetical protein
MYDGDVLDSMASVVRSPAGVYLANEGLGPDNQAQKNVVRL